MSQDQGQSIEPVQDDTDPVAPDQVQSLGSQATAALRREIKDRPASFAVDLASLVAIAWAVWWFADNDGGLRLADQRPFGGYLLLLTPLLSREWRRIRRPVAWLLVLLPLGALLSVAFAVDRSRFVNDALSYGSLPVLVLAASRLSRRRWSLHATFAVIVMGFLSWSWLAGLKWWGWTDLGMQPRWELVSWRNPSGILSGAFGVWFAGIMLAGKRSPTLIAGLLAALGIAGAQLSSSRAAIAFTLAGVVVTAMITARTPVDGRRPAPTSVVGRLAGLAVATVVVTIGLNSMLPPGTSTPMESRTQDFAVNSFLRTKHWEAALGMFADRPITGIGLGSYRDMASSYNPPDGNLTAAAHSAWFEGLGEGGLVFGVPLIGLAGALAAGVLGMMRGRWRAEGDDQFRLSSAIPIGAAGAAATIVAHASADFDLRYPTILSLVAIASGIVLHEFSHARRPLHDPAGMTRPWRVGAAALLPTACLLGIGWLGAGPFLSNPSLEDDGPVVFATARAPWDTASRVAATRILREAGELDAAMRAAEGPARWNPGSPSAVMNLARLRYSLGEITGQELLDLLPPPPTVLHEWPRTAVELFDGGDLRQAELAARRAIDFFPEYRAWGVTQTVFVGWQTLIRIGVLAEGCDEGTSLLLQAHDQQFDPTGNADAALDQWFTSEVCPT